MPKLPQRQLQNALSQGAVKPLKFLKTFKPMCGFDKKCGNSDCTSDHSNCSTPPTEKELEKYLKEHITKILGENFEVYEWNTVEQLFAYLKIFNPEFNCRFNDIRHHCCYCFFDHGFDSPLKIVSRKYLQKLISAAKVRVEEEKIKEKKERQVRQEEEKRMKDERHQAECNHRNNSQKSNITPLVAVPRIINWNDCNDDYNNDDGVKDTNDVKKSPPLSLLQSSLSAPYLGKPKLTCSPKSSVPLHESMSSSSSDILPSSDTVHDTSLSSENQVVIVKTNEDSGVKKALPPWLTSQSSKNSKHQITTTVVFEHNDHSDTITKEYYIGDDDATSESKYESHDICYFKEWGTNPNDEREYHLDRREHMLDRREDELRKLWMEATVHRAHKEDLDDEAQRLFRREYELMGFETKLRMLEAELKNLETSIQDRKAENENHASNLQIWETKLKKREEDIKNYENRSDSSDSDSDSDSESDSYRDVEELAKAAKVAEAAVIAAKAAAKTASEEAKAVSKAVAAAVAAAKAVAVAKAIEAAKAVAAAEAAEEEKTTEEAKAAEAAEAATTTAVAAFFAATKATMAKKAADEAIAEKKAAEKEAAEKEANAKTNLISRNRSKKRS